ncbi:hypothetical protein CFIO01_10252 [Colletotrichum fioriniae PJ7]|uniref:Uncharacterized protein n=1 Tax=Colletotrichum fioriniae PJ7 TaxID=1445577 RepID=A0A010RJ83_9PEZI|nr:hypothetical protein CFIO01_10252 [Colletotrichum fioriniae PJ7]
MESIRNIVNNNSALETTAPVTATNAVTSTMNLQQRIAKRRHDWAFTLTDGPVSSPGPKAKYRRSRNWSTRIGVDAPPNAERQTPVLYSIAISKSKSNIPSSPPSSFSSAIEGVTNDEYPLNAEEYRICPDTDSPRYKHESDVGLWSGPWSSPGPRARYARSRSWSSRQSDSGYSSGGEECVVGESDSEDGCKDYMFVPSADDTESESGSDRSKADDDIVMADASPISSSGDDDIIMAEYDGEDEDILMADYSGDGDILMSDYLEENDIEMADISEDSDIEMAEYDDEDVDVVMADCGEDSGSGSDSDSDISMSDYVEEDDIKMSDYSEDIDIEMADFVEDCDVDMIDCINDTRTKVFDYREVVETDSSSESGDSVNDRFVVYTSEYEDDSEDLDPAVGYYSDGDDSSDGGYYPGPDFALVDDNDAITVTTWSLDGTTLVWDSPNGSDWSSSPALSDRPEPDLISEYTVTHWVNGVSERMTYVDFDYSDIGYPDELPVVKLRLPEDEKDHYK